MKNKKESKEVKKSKSIKDKLLHLLTMTLPVLIVILIGFVCVIAVGYDYIDAEEKQKAYLAERADGVETTATVIDKYIGHDGKMSNYYITFISDGKTLERTVSSDKYDVLTEGDVVRVIIKDDTIYLGYKQDTEEAIYFVNK